MKYAPWARQTLAWGVRPGLVQQHRCMTSSAQSRKDASQIAQRMEKLRSSILSTNWNDYAELVLNEPFWSSEMSELENYAQYHLDTPLVSQLSTDLHELFDVLYMAEDARDHLLEVMESCNRSSGLAGTGIFASPAVKDPAKHATAAVAMLSDLTRKYPKWEAKIDECLGNAIRASRQKVKFRWSGLHEAFY